jgi:hypothetical protein
MRVSITCADLPSLKSYLGRSTPSIKPSKRIEAAARGLGFNTYGGLRNGLCGGSILASARDDLFCNYLGLPLKTGDKFNRFLSRALARIELHRVLDAHPNLTQRGFDNEWMDIASEKKKSLDERMALLKERRQEAYECDWSFDQFELAWIYLSRQEKIKSINRVTSSYGLKHRAENLQREFGHFEPLGNYVSNGMLIAAAYSLGFLVRPVAYDSYNAYLNISKLTVDRSTGRQRGSSASSGAIVAAMYSDPAALAA